MKNLSRTRLFAYLPPLVFVILVPLANFFPGLLNALGVQYLLALLGLAMVGVGLHLESCFATETSRVGDLEDSIKLLTGTQNIFLDRAARPIAPSGFTEGFKRQVSVGNRINTLRIFAISSQQILSFMRYEDFRIDNCHLLLRGFDSADTSHAEFAAQIRLVVRDWHRMHSEGRVANLTIRSYDFHPTEYQVIFDDRGMLSGLYDSDPSDYSEVSVRSPFYIDGSTADGRALITEYRQRFDNLFDICAVHHGKGCYDDQNSTTASN